MFSFIQQFLFPKEEKSTAEENGWDNLDNETKYREISLPPSGVFDYSLTPSGICLESDGIYLLEEGENYGK